MRNQKGITLIALVITIIVLLILAGVSIAMLTGNNGILTRATDSKTATSKAEALERVNMELNAQLTNAMAGVNFDSAAIILANIGTLPTGYTLAESDISVTQTSGSTAGSVSITLHAPSGVTLTTATGTVTKDATAGWKVTPVK